jgi:hypothetical protein
MRIMRFAWRPVLLVGMLLCGLSAAGAQGSDAARQACTPDAMRLCSQFIPNAAKVKSCMLAKRSQLSEACRIAMAGGRRIGRRRYYRHHYRYHYRYHYRHYRRRVHVRHYRRRR